MHIGQVRVVLVEEGGGGAGAGGGREVGGALEGLVRGLLL